MEHDSKGLKLRNLVGLTGSLQIDVGSTKDELHQAFGRRLVLQSNQLNLAAVAAALNQGQ